MNSFVNSANYENISKPDLVQKQCGLKLCNILASI